MFREFLRFDTARQLVVAALTRDDLDEGTIYGEGTLGELLASTVRQLLPGRSLERLRAEWRLSAGELEAELQAHLRFMQP